MSCEALNIFPQLVHKGLLFTFGFPVGNTCRQILNIQCANGEDMGILLRQAVCVSGLLQAEYMVEFVQTMLYPLTYLHNQQDIAAFLAANDVSTLTVFHSGVHCYDQEKTVLPFQLSAYNNDYVVYISECHGRLLRLPYVPSATGVSAVLLLCHEDH